MMGSAFLFSGVVDMLLLLLLVVVDDDMFSFCSSQVFVVGVVVVVEWVAVLFVDDECGVGGMSLL